MDGIWNCKLCDFVADGSHTSCLTSHLSDRHKIIRSNGTFQKYIDDYFPPFKCCCGCGNNTRLANRGFKFALFAPNCKGLHRSRSPGCIDFYLYQGFNVDEAITLFRDRQSKIATKHSTPELKQYLSTLNKGLCNPSSLKSISTRENVTIDEAKEIRSNITKGSKNGFYNKKHSHSTRVKLAQHRAKQSKIVTKPELALWGMLHALGVEFDFQVAIDAFIVDFKIGNMIIEVFGDYWHSEKMRADKPEHDQMKIDSLSSSGYDVTVLWESEIMKKPKIVVSKLQKLLDQAGIVL